MEKTNSLDSREYSISCFEEDPRMIRCKKEMIGVEFWGIGIIISALIVCYAMSQNPETFIYIWGYPAWYAIATLILITGALGTIIFAWKIMKRPNLSARDENGGK